MSEVVMKKWIISKERWEAPFDLEHGNLTPENFIEVSEEEYRLLNEKGNNGYRIVANNGKLEIQPVPRYSEEIYDQIEINGKNLKLLARSDWKVIRELERLYLQGTDLNLEREAYRSSVISVETPELK